MSSSSSSSSRPAFSSRPRRKRQQPHPPQQQQQQQQRTSSNFWKRLSLGRKSTRTRRHVASPLLNSVGLSSRQSQLSQPPSQSRPSALVSSTCSPKSVVAVLDDKHRDNLLRLAQNNPLDNKDERSDEKDADKQDVSNLGSTVGKNVESLSRSPLRLSEEDVLLSSSSLDKTPMSSLPMTIKHDDNLVLSPSIVQTTSTGSSAMAKGATPVAVATAANDCSATPTATLQQLQEPPPPRSSSTTTTTASLLHDKTVASSAAAQAKTSNVNPKQRNNNIDTNNDSDNNTTRFKVGQAVFVHAGTYKDMYARVQKVTAKKLLVAIMHRGNANGHANVVVGSTRMLSKKSCRRIVMVTEEEEEEATTRVNDDSDSTAASAAQQGVVSSSTPAPPPPTTTTRSKSLQSSDDPTTLESSSPLSSSCSFQRGQTVIITAGSHLGKQGRITKVTAKMVRLAIADDTMTTTVTPTSTPVVVVSKRKTSIQAVSIQQQQQAIEMAFAGKSSKDITSSSSEHDATMMATVVQDESAVSHAATTTTVTDIGSRTGADSLSPTESSSHGDADDETIGMVAIIGGKYKNKRGRLEHFTDKTVKVYIESLGRSVRVQRGNTTLHGSHAPPATSSSSYSCYSVGDEWRLPDSGTGGTRFGTRIIVKLRTQRQGGKRSEQNFLTHLFQDRLQVTETPLNQHETELPFDVKITGEGGFKYELLSSKVMKDGDANSGPFCQAKSVRLVYAQVSGPLRTCYSLKDELERLGDFACLSTRKVVARLELLQSPAYQFQTKQPGMFALQRSDFALFPNERNDGCGFISDDLLFKLCSAGGPTFAKRALAIQIRAVIPQMGIFKGVLMRKRMSPSEPQIQLMPSMKKVAASLQADADERAFVWITQQGMHPSKNNLMIGRLVDRDAKNPPKSFKPKRLSDDVVRLWQTLKVPKETCNAYVRKSMKTGGLQHASVLGVADPTSSLPEGHVFVTGMKQQHRHSLFVTRFPCNVPSDGRILPNVTGKPDTMSWVNWTWLNELPFGAIIFSDAAEGIAPLPEMVAEGDLDGDLYLVCWNQDIVQQIKPEPILPLPDTVGSKKRRLVGSGPAAND